MPHALRRAPLVALAALVLLLALASSASAQATRTWVSGVGDDVNPCSRTAPCKTIAGAISKTAAGGEINAIDSGGFGAVTITKSITIDFTGVQGSILNASTNGVIVNAGATDQVILRNLEIRGPQPGQGSGLCTQSSGLDGVRVLQAGAVSLENLTITNQTSDGVEVVPGAAGDVDVSVRNTDIGQVCGRGVRAGASAAGGKAQVVVDGSMVRRTGTGVSAGLGGTVTVARSSLLFNTLGVLKEADGVVNVFDDVLFSGNDADGTPSATLFGPQPPAQQVVQQPPAQEQLPPAQQPQQQAPAPSPGVAGSPAATCKVMKLTGVRLSTARSRLAKAGCVAGKVRSRKVKSKKLVGRVVAQGVQVGTAVLAGSKVDLVVGRR